MKPIEFKEQNVVFANQDDSKVIPAVYLNGNTIISCWKPSWKDIFRMIFGCNVWLLSVIGDRPVYDTFATTKKVEVFKSIKCED